MPAVHIIIKGKVQGVFFRATARDVADKIGIKGWIRNTIEGNVELVATGTRPQLDEYISWCKKGPPQAVVTEVVVDTTEEEQFDSFRIRKGG